jgi:hypothetical protein
MNGFNATIADKGKLVIIMPNALHDLPYIARLAINFKGSNFSFLPLL